MKRVFIIVLQVIIVLIAMAALVLLIKLPLAEGRAKNLDIIHVYADPFILYGYASSIAFFVALYKAFRLLAYIRENKQFSSRAVRALMSIRYCAIVIIGLIIAAGIYIRIAHNNQDDPAGFLSLCMVITVVCIAVAIVAARYETKLQRIIDGIAANFQTF